MTRGLWQPVRVSVALSVLTLCALAWSAPPAFAQASFSKITDFPAIDGYAAYNTPVQGPDGAFYGATYYGGTAGCNCGTIYRIDQYGVETMIHSFAGGSSDGANPEFNRLALAGDGNFYGTTVSGGANNQGTIFRISPSGTYAMIFSFNNSASPSTGYQPFGGLVLGPDGKLWGAATNGGAGGAGTIFNITTGGVFTVAHQLAGYNGTTYPDGANSYGGLAVGSDGLLYGTTWNQPDWPGHLLPHQSIHERVFGTPYVCAKRRYQIPRRTAGIFRTGARLRRPDVRRAHVRWRTSGLRRDRRYRSLQSHLLRRARDRSVQRHHLP